MEWVKPLRKILLGNVSKAGTYLSYAKSQLFLLEKQRKNKYQLLQKIITVPDGIIYIDSLGSCDKIIIDCGGYNFLVPYYWNEGGRQYNSFGAIVTQATNTDSIAGLSPQINEVVNHEGNTYLIPNGNGYGSKLTNWNVTSQFPTTHDGISAWYTTSSIGGYLYSIPNVSTLGNLTKAKIYKFDETWTKISEITVNDVVNFCLTGFEYKDSIFYIGNFTPLLGVGNAYVEAKDSNNVFQWQTTPVPDVVEGITTYRVLGITSVTSSSNYIYGLTTIPTTGIVLIPDESPRLVIYNKSDKSYKSTIKLSYSATTEGTDYQPRHIVSCADGLWVVYSFGNNTAKTANNNHARLVLYSFSSDMTTITKQREFEVGKVVGQENLSIAVHSFKII